MPALTHDQNIFAAGGTAATDWGQAGGAAQVDVALGASVKRGVDVDIGFQALASIDLGLSKFLTAELTGQAQAQASLRAQVQVPLNLFEEVGVAIRLQAIAELAASVQASLGLTFGDFIALIGDDMRLRGLPAQLARVFLDEVSISAGLYAKAALTAQAFAHVVISGTAIRDPRRNLTPGFNIVAGVGAGLKAGAGFRVFARLGVDNFSKLVGRSVDLAVDGAIDGALPLIPPADATTRRLLAASRAPAKAALRVAYELGEYIATAGVPATAQGAQMVAQRCVQVVLEEAQRFLLASAVEAGLSRLRIFIETQAATLTPSQWAATAGARQAMASHLTRLPAAPFEASQTNLDYWNEAAVLMANLGIALAGNTLGDDTRRAFSMVWSAAQLALAAALRVVRASGSVSIIGLPTGRAHAAFAGDLSAQPPAMLKDYIRARIAALTGRAAPQTLKMEDLVVFLTDAAVIDALRQEPAVDEFLKIFQGPIGSTTSDVANLLLTSAGALTMNASGGLDDRASLQAVTDALRGFVQDKLVAIVAPVVRNSLATQPGLRLYFDEVIIPTLSFTVDVAFRQVLQWDTIGPKRALLTEALSAVLMRLFGRSLVASADVLMATAQRQMSAILVDLAGHVDDPGGIVAALRQNPLAQGIADDIGELVRDGLLVGAEVFGPLPDATRARVRDLLYEVIEPLPLDADASFLDQLLDDAFVPNQAKMEALARELGGIALDRFVLFAQKILLRIAQNILEDLVEFFEEAVRQVGIWAEQVAEALLAAIERLEELVREIAELVEDVAELFEHAVDNLLDALGALDTQTGRTKFKDELAATATDGAADLLEDNFIYATLVPAELKSGVRATMRAAVRTALNAPVIDPILGAVGDLADGVDDIVTDIRGLNASQPLAPQIANRLLNRIAEAIEERFGSNDPGIDVRFDVTWKYYELDILKGEIVEKTARHTIDLGTIDLDLDDLLDTVRTVINGLASFQQAVTAMAANLVQAFAKELQLGEREVEHTAVVIEKAVLEEHHRGLAARSAMAAILSPAQAAVVEGPGKIYIRLDGVPRSFLIHDADTPQRVFIRLNEDDLPLSAFEVVEQGQSAGKPERPVAGIGGRLLHTIPASGMSSVTDMIGRDLHIAPHWASKQKPGAFGRTRGAGPAAMRAFPPVTRRAAAGRDIRVQSEGRKEDRRTGKEKGREKFDRRFGQDVSPSAILHGMTDAPPGLFLSRPLTPAECEEGLNTLVVAIIDGAGRRVETSVSFVMPAASPAGDGPRLPTRLRIDPSTLQPVRVPGKRLRRAKAERKAAARESLERLKTRKPDAARRIASVSPKIIPKLARIAEVRSKEKNGREPAQ